MDEITRQIQHVTREGLNCQDVDQLIKWRQELAGHGFYLSEMSADYYALYLEAYRVRKQQEAEAYMEARKTGVSVKDAEATAVIMVEKFRKHEADTEAGYKKFKSKVDQLNKVVDGLAQQISHVKRELEHFRFTQNPK